VKHLFLAWLQLVDTHCTGMQRKARLQRQAGRSLQTPTFWAPNTERQYNCFLSGSRNCHTDLMPALQADKTKASYRC
jgi:hypothetical protein